MTSTQHYSEISLTGAVVPGRLEEIAQRASTDGPWAVHVRVEEMVAKTSHPLPVHDVEVAPGWSVPISRWDTNRDAVHEAIRLGRAINCRVAISRVAGEQAR